MKPFYTLLAILLSMNASVHAQTLHWAKSFLGDSQTGMAYGQSSCVDPLGNGCFFVGTNRDSVNFDVGASNTTLVEPFPGEGFYVCRLAANGDFMWVRSFPYNAIPAIKSVAADSHGNSYLFGAFSGTMDCDPGTGTYSMTAMTAYNIFLIKLDPNGNFQWAQQYSAPGTAASSISIHRDFIHCTGMFCGTIDLDNSTGTNLHTTADFGNIFVLKLDGDGDFIWGRSFGATTNTSEMGEWANDVEVGPSGEVFVGGTFSKAGDFNPDAGTTTLTPVGKGDAFIVKLDEFGNFQWAASSGEHNHVKSSNLAISGDGFVYQSGTHADYTIWNQPTEDVYAARYDTVGNQLWEHQFGGPQMEQGIDLTVDDAGLLYFCGDYSSPSVDFDPGPGTALLENNIGHHQSFIVKMTPEGQLVWAESLSGTSSNSLFGLDYFGGKLYGTGYYFESLDCDPLESEYFIPPTINDYASAFVLKLDTNRIDFTGVPELETASFELYPNPTVGKVTIKIEQVLSGSALSIYNLQGQILFRKELDAIETSLDIDRLPAGTYLIEVSNSSHRSVLPLVKQ